MAVGALLAATGVAGAHGPTGTSAGAGTGTAIPLSVVVGASALVGVLTGLVAVGVASRRLTDALTDGRLTLGLGVGLVVLGLSVLAPVASRTPGFALAGAGVGIGSLVVLQEIGAFTPRRWAGLLAAATIVALQTLGSGDIINAVVESQAFPLVVIALAGGALWLIQGIRQELGTPD